MELDILVVWYASQEMMNIAVDTMTLADHDNIPVHLEIVDRTVAEADYEVDSHNELDLKYT